MPKTSTHGEIMRNAQRLVNSRGDGAHEYACNMAIRMDEIGEETDQAFWKKISKQVELLLYSDA